MTESNKPRPSEVFAEILDRYEYHGVEPIELWDTEDLLDMRDAIDEELQARNREAQEEYFQQQQSYGGTD